MTVKLVLVDNPSLEIVERQIELIRERSRMGPLSLEEVKILDILCKNLILLRKNPDDAIDVEVKKVKSLPNEELIKLAESAGGSNDGTDQ